MTSFPTKKSFVSKQSEEQFIQHHAATITTITTMTITTTQQQHRNNHNNTTTMQRQQPLHTFHTAYLVAFSLFLWYPVIKLQISSVCHLVLSTLLHSNL